MSDCDLIVNQGGDVTFRGSETWKTAIQFTDNVTVTIEGSSIQSSPISLNTTMLTFVESSVYCCDGAMTGTTIPISLEASNLTISNAMMTAYNCSSWFVSCEDNRTSSSSSWVSGDLLGWNISPQCKTQYNPLRITESTEFPLFMVGTTELVELELSTGSSGVNVTLILTPNSLISTNDNIEGYSSTPIAVSMYLKQSECTQNIQFTSESNYISSAASGIFGNEITVLNLSFDGPSPPFVEQRMQILRCFDVYR